MVIEPESLYRQLCQLVAEMPDLRAVQLTPEVQRWFGRAGALVSALSDPMEIATLRIAVNNFTSPSLRPSHAQEITAIVHRALAIAELKAPAAVQGAFLAPGAAFDVFQIVGKVLKTARNDLMIIDPYMDEKVLTDFAPLAAETVSLRVLSDGATNARYTGSLRTAATRWIQQYGAVRPLEARLTPQGALHDRLIIVDSTEVWSLTQSLKDFAARAPASMLRVTDVEVAALKVGAYQAIWANSAPI